MGHKGRLEEALNDLLGLLKSIEELAYKILVWIILIPKTLWRIITDPAWVPDYVKGELQQEKSAFDEHISPVFLLLIVGVIPALLISFLPDVRVVINSPAETEAITDRRVEFNAKATFISGSAGVADEYRWYVEQVLIDENGNLLEDQNGNLIYTEIYREIYNESTDRTNIVIYSNSSESQGEVSTVFDSEQVSNSSNDTFFYTFEKPGVFFVNVEAARFNPNENNPPLEEYYSYLAILVPENPEETIKIINSVEPSQTARSDKSQVQQFRELLTSEKAIFLALIFMMPPLLFAFAAKVLVGEAISENSLKENFYAQCYYFAPLSLAFWATLYSLIFYTIDIFFYNDSYRLTMLMPLMLAALWFICTEIYALAVAGKTNIWKSILAVFTCLVIIGSILTLIVLFFGLQDDLRRRMIWAYPLAFYILLVAIILLRSIDWVSGRKRLSVGDVILVISFLPSTVIFVGGNLLGMTLGADTPTPTAMNSSISFVDYNLVTPVAPTPAATALVPTETPLPTALPTVGGNPVAYTLHRGEFPYCLARRFNVHPAQLLAANALSDGQRVPPGTALVIPQNNLPFPGNRALRNHPATYLVITSDETLYSIACLFGDVDPGAIAYANGMSTDAVLSAGQQLQIP